jgi:hypothetical protein
MMFLDRGTYNYTIRTNQMGLRLYCNRYEHFKDPLVCSVVCPYRTRCQDFALYYDIHRTEVDVLVADYFETRNQTPGGTRVQGATTVAVPVEIRTLIRLEVKREMVDNVYIWISKDNVAELVRHEEVIRRAEIGSKPKAIYKVAQEMELKFQLVPRKRIEKAKRIAASDAERAAAKRRGPRPVETDPLPPLTAVADSSPEKATRTQRARNRKAVGER